MSVDTTDIALIFIGAFYLIIACMCIVKRECKHQRVVFDESLVNLVTIKKPSPVFVFRDMEGRAVTENV